MRRPGFSWQPTLRVEQIVLVVLTYLLVIVNTPWWSAVLRGRDALAPGTWLFAVGALLALVALHFVVIASLCHRWTVKPLLIVVVIASAVSVYFMRTYSVVLDPTMIQNVLHTDTRESRELLSMNLLGSVFATSVLPLLFLARVRVADLPWKRAVGIRVLSILAALVVAVVSLLAIGRDLTPFMRNQPTARYLITPGNLINGLVVNAVGSARDVAGPRRPIGLDARMLPSTGADGTARTRPRVLVFVLGETARAANFSLLGYPRDTNPELSTRDIVAFSNVRSCGTSTEVSVPCLFSVFGREQYDERAIRQSEGLLDVLVRAGVAVKWRDNQSGCKGVCQGAGIDYMHLDQTYAPDLCNGEDCLDEILLRRLTQDLDEAQRDTAIVLHMIGNHGPAYYRRYPPRFRRFVPDCATAELRECSREAIVNAFDNGILYTDYVLSGIIDELGRRAEQLDGAMIYVSDHGESLGEGGLYLHGIPYAVAPKTQTHVPLVTWVSDGWRRSSDLDMACVRASASSEISHDYIFHSILGLLDVSTSIYRPERDFLRACRQAPGLKVAP
jgi:lipid A ethanolaminephosphotransferase